MSDRLQIIERMEQALEPMLERAAPPALEPVKAEPPLDGALPALDEVLAPAADRVAEAQRRAAEADAVLEDATVALRAWQQRLDTLRAARAPYDNPSDPAGASATG
jgi:hypothetical protein